MCKMHIMVTGGFLSVQFAKFQLYFKIEGSAQIYLNISDCLTLIKSGKSHKIGDGWSSIKIDVRLSFKKEICSSSSTVVVELPGSAMKMSNSVRLTGKLAQCQQHKTTCSGAHSNKTKRVFQCPKWTARLAPESLDRTAMPGQDSHAQTGQPCLDRTAMPGQDSHTSTAADRTAVSRWP